MGDDIYDIDIDRGLRKNMVNEGNGHPLTKHESKQSNVIVWMKQHLEYWVSVSHLPPELD